MKILKQCLELLDDEENLEFRQGASGKFYVQITCGELPRITYRCIREDLKDTLRMARSFLQHRASIRANDRIKKAFDGNIEALTSFVPPEQIRKMIELMDKLKDKLKKEGK